MSSLNNRQVLITGEAREIGVVGAVLLCFLVSDDAKFITGQCFIIDGGEIAGGLASQTK